MAIRYIIGDARDGLRGLPAESVHSVITSPPYWNLRDYSNDPVLWGASPNCPHDFTFRTEEDYQRGWPCRCVGCGAWRGTLGNEPSPDLFIDHLCEVFDEVWRVLRDDGILWVNLGDSYAGDAKWGGKSGGKNAGRHFPRKGSRSLSGVQPKELIGVPWAFAFAMRHCGWRLRQEIIWAKPNPMTESCEDRCVKAHEPIFMFTKAERYFYDYIAIQEPVSGGAHDRGAGSSPKDQGRDEKLVKSNERFRESTNDLTLTRNKRSVWTVSVASYSGSHFAVFPPKLIEPCVLASTSEHGYCSCGSPWKRIIERDRVPTRPAKESKLSSVSGLDPRNPHEAQHGMIVGNRDPERHIAVKRTIGWEPTCRCEVPNLEGRGLILDPFAGSGTTGEVASAAGLDAILIDCNPEYSLLQKRRNAQGSLL